MWGWMLALFCLSMTNVYMEVALNQQQQDYQASEVNSLALNMRVYRHYVLTYAAAHPTVSGTVADSSLPLDTWFSRMNGVANYVTNGHGYVYYTGPNAGTDLAWQLAQTTDANINAGINHNGFVFSPIYGTTTIPVPAAIPNNAVVLANG